MVVVLSPPRSTITQITIRFIHLSPAYLGSVGETGRYLTRYVFQAGKRADLPGLHRHSQRYILNHLGYELDIKAMNPLASDDMEFR